MPINIAMGTIMISVNNLNVQKFSINSIMTIKVMFSFISCAKKWLSLAFCIVLTNNGNSTNKTKKLCPLVMKHPKTLCYIVRMLLNQNSLKDNIKHDKFTANNIGNTDLKTGDQVL